jgi:hypothetical protein
MTHKRSIIVDTSTEMAEVPQQSVVPKDKPLTHMTVAAFLKQYKDQLPGPINPATYGEHGKCISRLSREREIEIVKVPDARWGEVNGYNIALMKTYFQVKE